MRAVITCEHCGRILAETDGERLYLGRTSMSPKKALLRCEVCKQQRMWRPAALEALAPMCYTEFVTERVTA